MVSIENIDVRELLPQKGKFVMIDRLKYLDEKLVSSCLTVKNDNIFVSGDLLNEAGIIENIAQTAAARMGYIAKYLDNGEVKLGFIGEIKNLVIERCPRTNEELNTSVEIVNEIFSTLLVHAETKIAGEMIAACDMKVFITEINSVK